MLSIFSLGNGFFNSSITSECGDPQLGDLNCDGLIDLLDIIIVVNIIHDIEYTSDYELWSSDLNSDNSIDIYDIIIIIGIILND